MKQAEEHHSHRGGQQVGEGTAFLRTGVFPSIFQYLVDKFQKIFTSLINIQVLFIVDQ